MRSNDIQSRLRARIAYTDGLPAEDPARITPGAKELRQLLWDADRAIEDQRLTIESMRQTDTEELLRRYKALQRVVKGLRKGKKGPRS